MMKKELTTSLALLQESHINIQTRKDKQTKIKNKK
jgi:hypothetical protein